MRSEAEKILTKHHRFELLDAMRGIGAIFVATLHTPSSMQMLLPFRNSYLAVDLFFCLSGFVIAFAYEGRLQRGMSFRQFMAARLIRLYPLYLLGLLLGAIAIVGRSHFLPVGQRSTASLLSAMAFGLLMLPAMAGKHITENVFPLNPPSWSLFFEMFINVAYAGLILLRKAGSTLLLAGALVSLALIFNHTVLHDGSIGEGFTLDRRFFSGFPRVTYSFLTGVLLFRIHKARPNLKIAVQHTGLVGASLLIVLVFIFGTQFGCHTSPLYPFLLVGFIMPFLIFTGAAVTVSDRWKPVCFFLGECSYPLYILHLPLLSPLYAAQRLHLHGLGFQIVAPIAIIALVFIARWVAVHYDSPMRRYLMSIEL